MMDISDLSTTFLMPKILKNVNIRNFMLEKYVLQHKIPYICIVFFMVLDLRLTEIDCRETINFFCPYPWVENGVKG